jgi:hypothetical protein
MAAHLETTDLHRMAPIRCLLDNDRSYGGPERTRETSRASRRPSGIRPVAGIPTSRQPGCATTHRARRRRHGPLLGVLPRRAGRPCEVAVPAGDGSAARRGSPGPMTPRSPPSDARVRSGRSVGVVMVPYRLEPRTRRQRTQPAKIRAVGAETAQQCGRVRRGRATLPGKAGYRSDHQMPDGRWPGAAMPLRDW